MCDTLCALSSCTENETVLFAKNSDRSPNEPHLVIRIPAKKYPDHCSVQLTYLTIPQVNHTYEIILCKPSWIWGAEMGVNEASVAIGNEAVFTKNQNGPDALTGMDLVRLALERCSSAVESVELITTLLEKYGQGGNCGYDHKFYYENSFLVVDLKEGYILETSGKKWAAKKIDGFHAISNRLSLHTDHQMRGGIDPEYDFAKKLTKPFFTHISGSKHRLASSWNSYDEPMNARKMMDSLRRHFPKDEAKVFTHGSVRSLCMHAGGIVGDHTTGSLVVELRKNNPSTLWITGASTPCISAFKPTFFGINSGSPVFLDEAPSKEYWLRRELIHRSIIAGKTDVSALRNRRNKLESNWLKRERELFLSKPSIQDLHHFAREASEQEEKMISEFFPESLFLFPSKRRFYQYWKEKNAVLFK